MMDYVMFWLTRHLVEFALAFGMVLAVYLALFGYWLVVSIRERFKRKRSK